MAKYSIIFGILLSALLYCLLTLSRLGKYEEPDMKILEVEVVEMPAPPAPPEMEVPEEEPDDLPPPPTPDIDMVETLAPLDQPVIELSPNKISITTPVETFRQTNAVADLPAPPVVKKAAPKKAVVRTVARTEFAISELDNAPKVIRKGKFRWPRTAKGRSAKISLRLKITKTGDVKVIKLLSSDNPDLNETAIRVATQTKFTPPRKNGKVVEATYTKTFQLMKP